MIFDSLIKLGRKDLEIKCQQLIKQSKKKQTELENKERQIKHMAKNIRQWNRKYQELEMSLSENMLERSELHLVERNEETKRLHKMLLKLNYKNSKLKKRLQTYQKQS